MLLTQLIKILSCTVFFFFFWSCWNVLCANVTVEDIGVIKSCPYHVVPGCHRDARSPLEYFGHLLFGLLVVLILTIALPYSTPFLFLAKLTWFVRVK